MLVMVFLLLEYSLSLCSWIVGSYQGMISIVVFLQIQFYQCQRTRMYQGHPSKRRNGSGAGARATKEVGGPCGCSAQCLMQPVYSVQVAHLDPWLPKHPWRCGCQTATESTHISNQKLQPPQGAALQIQWSKDPFPTVYWITVSRKITYDQDEYTVQTSFHNETFIRP